MKSLRVAIVGATGAVGQEMLTCLERSRLNIQELRLFASANSAGRTLSFRAQDLPVEVTAVDAFGAVDLVLLAVSSQLASELAIEAAKRGAVVIDNSSAFRGSEDTPLIIPELNAAHLQRHRGIVANPNCSTIVTLMALGPMARSFGLKSIVASTYQAVSGAGAAGLDRLQAEMVGGELSVGPFSTRILNNLIPFVGTMTASGETDEEQKMRHESRKILDLPDLQVVCTCVRVATKRAHAISALVELKDDPDLDSVIQVLKAAPGLRYLPDGEAAASLNPLEAEGRDEVLVGRLRKVDRRQFALFVVGDQLLKGAARNAVQIAELVFGS